MSSIRNHRKARALTQEQLAKLAGMSRSYLAELEKGTKTLNDRVRGRLAEALRVKPRELFDDMPASSEPEETQLSSVFLSRLRLLDKTDLEEVERLVNHLYKRGR